MRHVFRSAMGITPRRAVAVLTGAVLLTSIAAPVAFAREDTLAVESQSLVVEAPEEIDGVPTYGANQPRFFIGVMGVAPDYSPVILIMVCLLVGRAVIRRSRRCAGFHAPAVVLS